MRGAVRIWFGEGGGAVLAVDDRPVEHDAVELGARPVEHGDRDPSERARFDGLDDLGAVERFGHAFALDVGFLVIDAARDVGGDHELQIDLLRA